MRSRSARWVFALVSLAAVTGCPRREQVGVSAMSILGPGVINDPKNKSLRFDLLKFGLDEFCREMRVRGTPLKMRDGEPVIGRFFAESCGSQVIDQENRQSFVVQFTGKGYTWTNVTGRLGFTSAGLIEYAPDFQLRDGRMWIYFRPRNIDATRFQTTLVESDLARTGISLTGVQPDQIGRNVLDGQLKRGFTVIRHGASGETEFGMGFVPVGERPFRPFQVQSEDKILLDNDRTEVHTGQQDFIGGFEVTSRGQALYLTMKVDGSPTVDVLVIRKDVGDRLLDQYVRQPGPAPLTEPPLLDDTIQAGGHFKRYVSLPKGHYYLMLDQTSLVGRSTPPATAGDDRAARVDYVVQLGDAP
jgi:hypothetical protein